MRGRRWWMRAVLAMVAVCLGLVASLSPSCVKNERPIEPRANDLWHEVSYETTRLV